MPIYEFRCLECNEISEFIFTSSDEKQEIKCRYCGGFELERVLSTSNFSIASASKSDLPSVSNRNCSTGSCSTIEFPGLDD